MRQKAYEEALYLLDYHYINEKNVNTQKKFYAFNC